MTPQRIHAVAFSSFIERFCSSKFVENLSTYMSSRNINDEATVRLFVNGEQAEDAMKRLTKTAEDLDKQLQAALAAGDKKQATKLQRELDKVNRELNRTESAAKGTGIVLNDLSNSSIHGLRNALKYLQKELRMTKPNTQDWNEYAEQIKEVQARIDELNGELEEQKSLWERFKDWSETAWPALDLLRQWGSGIVDIGRGAVEAFAEMDQEMANVRKFTGMSAEGVAALNEEFQKMDTRTSREDLNKLAQEAGRLGKTSPEDIMGFVRAADKVNVALDDLGEGATLTLSKLTGVFGYEQMYGTEQSLLKVGSVINELSQNCSASAPYLADFASRMGGVGAQANMTIPQIMAFGAVLDANGQQVEASSTALSQVIVRMMQEPAKYAKVAGLDVKKFSDMLKTDVNGALIMFLDTLQKAGGMDVLSPMFKDMGENGSRAISALSTLATHIDEVKAQQEAANVAFKEGTSIDKEFSVQNTTVQASLDKAKKAVNDIRVELGEKLSPVMSHVISSSTALLRVIMMVIRFITENKTAVISLTAGVVAYTVAVNMAAIKTAALNGFMKLFNVFMAAQRLVIIAATSAWSLLTGNITRATAAFRLFSAAIKANPIGLVVSVITTAIVALTSWISKTNEAKKAEKELTRQREEEAREFQAQISNTAKASADYAKGELDRLKKLYDATQDQTKSQKQRLAAVMELQKTYPTAFGNLSREQILAGNAASAYRDLASSIIKAARAKAIADKIKDNEKLLLQYELEEEDLNESIDKQSKEYNQAKYDRDSYGRELSGKYALSISGPTKSERRQLENLDDSIQTLNNSIDKSAERLDLVRLRSDQLRETNERLIKKAEKAGDPAKIAPDVKFDFGGSSVPSSSTGTGYTSQVLAEKDAKQAKAAARAAAVAAKKEFKEALDQIKAARDKEQAEIMSLRMMGEINYLEYNKRKLAADEKYYDDSIALYEKWGIQEDDQCQALARKREEFLNKANQQRLALNKEAIQRVAQAEERDLKARYAYKSSHTLAEELRLEEELLTIRYNALMDQQALYKKTDKEYEDYQRQIDDIFLKDQEEKQKKLLAKIEEFRKKYEYQPVKVKYDMERAALEELYRLKKIREEEYRRWLKKLNEQEAEDVKKEKDELPGMQKPDNPKNRAKAARDKYEDQKRELDEALADGIINESEYQTALQRIEADLRKSLISPLMECKSEWVSLLSTMAESWAEFADALKDPDGDPFSALGNAITATAGIVTSVMSSITEFQKAEYEIQAAQVKKRYDAEIDAAQGNSYKVRKLEKQREKDLANLKKEQSKKQFALQVIATIAQTAANAVQAYSAGLSIGGPAGLIMAPIAAALAVAQGAVQIALIKKQQQAAEAQGYSKGGFTKKGGVNEPAGIVHAGEWVASQKLLANPVARPMIEALDYAQRTNTIGSLKDEDVSRSIRATDSMVRMAESDGSSALMVAAVVQNAEAMAALNERLKQPIDAAVSIAGEHGFVQAEDKYNRYLKNKSPKDF